MAGGVDANLCISESEFAKTLSLGGGIRTSAYRNHLNGGFGRQLVTSAILHHSRCGSSTPATPTGQSVSNASHMKVAQKPRGTARFRSAELPGRNKRRLRTNIAAPTDPITEMTAADFRLRHRALIAAYHGGISHLCRRRIKVQRAAASKCRHAADDAYTDDH